MRLVPLLDIGFYTMLRREIQLKCELYNENFQNFKSYNMAGWYSTGSSGEKTGRRFPDCTQPRSRLPCWKS